MTTPPPATPPPMDVSGASPTPSLSPVKKEGGTGEDPILMRVGGKFSTPALSDDSHDLQEWL